MARTPNVGDSLTMDNHHEYVVDAIYPGVDLEYDDAGWYYTNNVLRYCTKCDKRATTGDHSMYPHKSAAGMHYNRGTKTLAKPEKIRLTHHPNRGEWVEFTSLDDVRAWHKERPELELILGGA